MGLLFGTVCHFYAYQQCKSDIPFLTVSMATIILGFVTGFWCCLQLYDTSSDLFSYFSAYTFQQTHVEDDSNTQVAEQEELPSSQVVMNYLNNLYFT